MLPFTLVAALIFTKKEEYEVRVEELGREGFSFQTAEELLVSEVIRVEVHFYHGRENRYEKTVLERPEMMSEGRENGAYRYRVSADKGSFRGEVDHFWREYAEYVKLKTEEEDGRLSQVLTGYPAEDDRVFAKDFRTQKLAWLQSAVGKASENEAAWKELSFELALSLDRRGLYEAYLQKPLEEFVEDYWAERGLTEHPLATCRVDRLYVGNQFCHNLFPKREQLFHILEKAGREGVAVTLVTTYLREEFVEETETFFEEIAHFGKEHETVYEVVINDWGMASLLRDLGFSLSLGVLLNKRRKDPRLQYSKDYQSNPGALEQNNLQMPFYREFLLERWGIAGYEWEACGPVIAIPEGSNHLHLPFYQTNTSQYCTLAARCQEGRRGAQRLMRDCPGYCSEYAFLYPEHLRMAGLGNSLFGYEECALADWTYLEDFLRAGAERLVITLF